MNLGDLHDPECDFVDGFCRLLPPSLLEREQIYPFGFHSNTVSEIWEATRILVDSFGHLRVRRHPVPMTI